MATTTFSNPKMSFKYYFIDNGRYRNTTNRGRTYFPARLTHYAETLQEAIEEAKGMTCGRRIEIIPRYGLGNAVAYVEPDGTVIQGMDLVNYLRNENTDKSAWLKEGATVNAKYFGKVIIKELRPGHSGATEYATIVNEHGTLLMQLCPVWQLTEIR